MALPELRYSKMALAVFGTGLALGFVVVVVGLPRLGRLASVTMALSLVALPVALILDWRHKRPAAPAKRPRKAARKRRAATPRRSAHRRR